MKDKELAIIQEAIRRAEERTGIWDKLDPNEKRKEVIKSLEEMQKE